MHCAPKNQMPLCAAGVRSLRRHRALYPQESMRAIGGDRMRLLRAHLHSLVQIARRNICDWRIWYVRSICEIGVFGTYDLDV